MTADQLARRLFDLLTSQPGDGIGGPPMRPEGDLFGYRGAGDGRTILDGRYDLTAVALALLEARPGLAQGDPRGDPDSA
jgi:hypothetical protein